MVDGRPAVVLFILPRLVGRPPAGRVTHAPPCRLCEAPLQWHLPAGRWRCSECADTPSAAHLEEWAREHVRDGSRAGKGRRDRGTRSRQVARGAPGAGAVLLAAARDGGAPSRAYLADRLTGAERRALRWVLRDDGDRPLSAEQLPGGRRRTGDHDVEQHGEAGTVTGRREPPPARGDPPLSRPLRKWAIPYSTPAAPRRPASDQGTVMTTFTR